MPIDIKAILSELDTILGQAEKLRKTSKYDDCSDLDGSDIAAMITKLAATVDRFAPPDSRYVKLQQVELESGYSTSGRLLSPLIGILTALRDDISSNRLATITQLLHADLFGDFLDMAQHLLDEGYKDPAAVLAGGVLEEHLRKLCLKYGLPIVVGMRFKKADAMNSELVAASTYSKNDQKNVTAWLGLRNEAAHGHYAAYKPEQVALLIQSIRDFITRIPA
jgi:hypothetical protein